MNVRELVRLFRSKRATIVLGCLVGGFGEKLAGHSDARLRSRYTYCAPRNSPTSDPMGLVMVFLAMVRTGVPRRYIRYAATTPERTVPTTISLLIFPSFDIRSLRND